MNGWHSCEMCGPPVTAEKVKASTWAHNSHCGTIYTDIVLKVNSLSFIIHYGNRTPPAASHYTYSTFTDSTRIVVQNEWGAKE